MIKYLIEEFKCIRRVQVIIVIPCVDTIPKTEFSKLLSLASGSYSKQNFSPHIKVIKFHVF